MLFIACKSFPLVLNLFLRAFLSNGNNASIGSIRVNPLFLKRPVTQEQPGVAYWSAPLKAQPKTPKNSTKKTVNSSRFCAHFVSLGVTETWTQNVILNTYFLHIIYIFTDSMWSFQISRRALWNRFLVRWAMPWTASRCSRGLGSFEPTNTWKTHVVSFFLQAEKW